MSGSLDDISPEDLKELERKSVQLSYLTLRGEFSRLSTIMMPKKVEWFRLSTTFAAARSRGRQKS
eukprot:1708041-Amphidinium_carterae.1